MYRSYVVVSMRMRYIARFYLGDSQSLNDLFSTNTVVVFVGEGKERESVVPANLCIVVGCATKRARGYRDRRGKGGQLDVVCGTFLGLNQVRGVAAESDEDREVRLQALRTKKVLDPGSVPLELVVSVLVTVVSFTLTCFSSHLIVTGTDHHVSLQTAPGTVGMLSTSPRMWPPLFRFCPAFPLNWMSGRRGPTRAIGTSVSDVQWCTELSSGWSHTTSTTTLSQITCINPVLL